MRSCVDFPDPSDHSTMIRVPGRSSAEKNISFFAGVVINFFSGGTDLEAVAIEKEDEYRFNIEKSPL